MAKATNKPTGSKTKSSKKSMITRREMKLGALIVLAITALAVAGYSQWLNTPPPIPTTAAQAVDVLSSSRFQHMHESRQEPYYEKTRELFDKLPREERRALREKMRGDHDSRMAMRDAMQQGMVLQAANFVRADPLTRKGIMDQQIQEMKDRMAEWAQRRAEGGNRERGERPQRAERPEPTEEQRKEWEQRRANRQQQREERFQNRIEHGNPQRQAYMAEYFKAMREAREKSGMPSWGGRGRRGGGGGGGDGGRRAGGDSNRGSNSNEFSAS